MSASRFDRYRPALKVAGLLAAGLVLGLLFGGSEEGASRPSAASAGGAKWYTCSMHPQIRLPDPKARCPICGMELIPVTEETSEAGSARQLVMSEGAKRLAEVKTAPVERRFVVKEVRLVGKVDYDETRLRSITAWVPGRLDRLYVDYTGVAVRKAAPMVFLYSPELLVAQEALLEADRALAKMRTTAAAGSGLEMQQATVDALEQRLRLWGLTDEQIAEIRKRGSASDHMTILSPISGIVIHKNAVQGDYVAVGTKIYQIADLSSVWVYLDAYESDMEWIRYAQEVEFEAEAYPGEVFRGRISFIDPFLDERTRTVKLRVNVDNADGRLKPGMFVRARIHARLAEGGRIVEPFLQGKWISPVHPEIVMDAPGECPICGTPLASAASLGYAGADATAPLVIPATAPLRTGKRAVAYVEVPGTDRPTYEGREILLGPRASDSYLVTSGLKEGEQVVVKGNFKIDSALQILARPSMMSPTEAAKEEARLNVPSSFLVGLSPLLDAYLQAQRALAADDLEAAHEALARIPGAVDGVDMASLAAPAHERWMDLRKRLAAAAREGSVAAELGRARTAFDAVSGGIVEVVDVFGQATGRSLREAFCPMAFGGRGAAWLQEGETIANPYYGATMLDCGEFRRTFAPLGAPRVRPAFVRALGPFLDALLATQRALAADDWEGARKDAALAARALDGVTAEPGEGLDAAWSELRARGAKAAEAVAGDADIEASRAAFEEMAGVGVAMVHRFGHARRAPLIEAFCPMAFDGRGAAWLQEGEAIANPYFGTEMADCGEIRARFPPATLGATAPAIVREAISGCVKEYLSVGSALAADDLESARTAAAALDSALAAVPTGALKGEALALWRPAGASMREAAASLRKAADLEAARRPFALLSDALTGVLNRLGHAGPDDLVSVHCPMAFSNRGAHWIQRGEDVHNPYFGAAMLYCGEVQERFPETPED